MKFQDSSFNGLKVTVGTKSVTHPPTHAPKAICPINFFKVGGIMKTLTVKQHIKGLASINCPRANNTVKVLGLSLRLKKV